MNRVIDYLLNNWLEIIIGTFGVALLSVSFFQVINRYIFQIPFVGTEEMARYFSIWAILFAAARGIRVETHIRIDFFMDRFPAKFRFINLLIVDILCIFFLVILTVKSIEILPIMGMRLSPALELPMWYIYIATPISAIIMIYFLIFKIIKKLPKQVQ